MLRLSFKLKQFVLKRSELRPPRIPDGMQCLSIFIPFQNAKSLFQNKSLQPAIVLCGRFQTPRSTVSHASLGVPTDSKISLCLSLILGVTFTFPNNRPWSIVHCFGRGKGNPSPTIIIDKTQLNFGRITLQQGILPTPQQFLKFPLQDGRHVDLNADRMLLRRSLQA